MSKNEHSFYYTKYDLNLCNNSHKAWVCLFDDIFDLTKLIQKNITTIQAQNTLDQAGKDVTHFFNQKTKLPIRQHPYIESMKTKRDLQQKKLLHFDNKDCQETPWYQDKSLIIGRLTKRSVPVKFINTLCHIEDQIKVPIEETLDEICYRYLELNYHAKSYTWKDIEGRPLDMSQTLDQNGLLDDQDEMDYLEIPEEERCIATIFLHFNDDLSDLQIINYPQSLSISQELLRLPFYKDLDNLNYGLGQCYTQLIFQNICLPISYTALRPLVINLMLLLQNISRILLK